MLQMTACGRERVGQVAPARVGVRVEPRSQSPGLFTHVGVVAAERGTDGVRRFVIVDLPEREQRIDWLAATAHRVG